MMKCFIGFALDTYEAGLLSGVQDRARATLHATHGNGLKVAHGQSPLHMTFVPPFPIEHENRLHELEHDLDTLIGEVRSVPAILDGISTFGSDTIFASVAPEYHSELSILRDAAASRVTGAELPERFTPHVSLARKFEHGRFPEIQEAFMKAARDYAPFPIPLEVDSLTLFLRPKGVRVWAPRKTLHFGRREAT
jgi:2'-5' RNA ligase